MSNKHLIITWATQGDISWEDWWVKQYGRTRTKIPTKTDHISFANYDLKKIGCSGIIEADGKFKILQVPGEKVPAVMEILYYHGFEVVSDQDDN